jgi:uncharacterized protein YutE (UPF0331/DUF86 family)
MSNDESTTRRLHYLRERVRRLEELRACTLDQYLADIGLRDQVERNYQLAVECCIDIASHFLAVRRLPRPERRRDVFLILAQAGLLPRDFADVMSEMVSLRNRLVHVYMAIDPVEMYQHLQEDILHFEAFEAIVLAWMEDQAAQQGGDTP